MPGDVSQTKSYSKDPEHLTFIAFHCISLQCFNLSHNYFSISNKYIFDQHSGKVKLKISVTHLI